MKRIFASVSAFLTAILVVSAQHGGGSFAPVTPNTALQEFLQ